MAAISDATSQPLDGEMNARVAQHRARRPAHWALVEEPLALARVLREQAAPGRCLLVDCLTLWLVHFLEQPAAFMAVRQTLLDTLAGVPGDVLLVSNEIGCGVVPLGEISRKFVDESGWLHQKLASLADKVTFCVAGLPMVLKS